MADRMAAEIHIGGRISLSIVPELCNAIEFSNVSLQYGDRGFRPSSADDLTGAAVAVDGRQLLILCDDESRWGEFEELEQFLQEHDIPFDRFSEGRYEYAPEAVRFRPGAEPVTLLTTPDRQPIVSIESLAEVAEFFSQAVEQLQRGEHAVALASFTQVQSRFRELLPSEILPLEAFEIVNP